MAINLHSIEEEVVGPYARSSISVGEIFYKARQEKKLDLGDIAKELRIRKDYLKAIEAGRKEELPDMCYVAGFIKTYAVALGLNPQEMLDRYKAQEREEEEQEEAQTVALSQAKQTRRTPSQAVLFGCLAVFVAVLIYWQSTSEEAAVDMQLGQEQTAPTVVEAPETADVIAQEPAVEGAEVVAEDLPTVEKAVEPAVEKALAEPQQVVEAPVEKIPVIDIKSFEASLENVNLGLPPSVIIRAKQETWVQIGDGETLPIISKVMLPGEVYRVPASEKELKLLTGNAGGLEILVDDKPVPALGAYGKILQNVQLDPTLLAKGTAVLN